MHEEIIQLTIMMRSKYELSAIAFLLIINNSIKRNVQDNDTSRKKLFDLDWKFNYENIKS